MAFMSDELSREVIDQIIFGMENQDQCFLYDSVERVIVGEADVPDDPEPDRYLELPEWNSSMGFHLMERFVASLRNPVFRDVLRGTLSSGRGVFRNFKNALKERPDIEKLWYHFKEQEMRKLVLEWFNEYRETMGLGRIAIDDEETTELVLSDFKVGRPETMSDEDVAVFIELDKAAFYEVHPDYSDSLVDRIYERLRRGKKPATEDVLVASLPDGGIAGFLWYEQESVDDATTVGWILQLTVVPEYRGLGIATALLERCVEAAVRDGVDRLFIEVGGTHRDFVRVLEATGFEQHSAELSLDVQRWGDENLYV